MTQDSRDPRIANNARVRSISFLEMMGERKPCPFCGGSKLTMNLWEEYIICETCDASAPVMGWQFRNCDKEIQAEREACAQTVERLGDGPYWNRNHAEEFAQAIRLRGEDWTHAMVDPEE